ncbi:MAG: AlwI family type II restriction endonuclease [Endomicrobium sp.]|nr:AlwI family type II restriction endonuclease [Endomicrobium sp.]
MVQKRAEYKPLLFTTTMRNSERLKAFLVVLMKYNEKLLTDSVIGKVAKSLIQKGLYKPTKVSVSVKNKWNSGIKLNKKEVDKIFTDNPQQHKEASFEKGWASRFDTWFKLAKELGFVWYFPNEKIKFSDSGKILLDFANPENELFVFANAFAKYQRNNPFRAVANKNTPLILLIKTINFLNERKETNGISRKELPLRESFSTRRHLETFINKGIKAYSVFISPQTFIDTKRYFNFIKNDGFEIRTSEISTFVNALENCKTLNEVTSAF